jgi:hypothetical protein
VLAERDDGGHVTGAADEQISVFLTDKLRRVHDPHVAPLIRHPHSDGRACFDRKAAEGKTGKEALRALKRQVSEAIYARLQAGAGRLPKLTAREGDRGRL